MYTVHSQQRLMCASDSPRWWSRVRLTTASTPPSSWFVVDGSRRAASVMPERLRTLDHGRPWRDDQFASTRLSSSRDISR